MAPGSTAARDGDCSGIKVGGLPGGKDESEPPSGRLSGLAMGPMGGLKDGPG